MGFSKYTTSEEVKPVTEEQNERIQNIVKKAGQNSAEQLTPEQKEEVQEILTDKKY